ncbi:phosphoribosyltransferase-like protein, partial [Pseudomonas aeruginosa]|uniref:phosphoribosyltransferase-like protein n=1 Tax=Pseudomonas aeruginosa TaxID=287 RepID=UPI004037D5F4
MGEMDDLLEQVATTIRTYRVGQVDAPTPNHVGRWLSQFTPDKQLPLLREFNHVVKKSFFTEEWIVGFLETLSENQKLAGADPANYWAAANILSIQQVGQSQREMVAL